MGEGSSLTAAFKLSHFSINLTIYENWSLSQLCSCCWQHFVVVVAVVVEANKALCRARSELNLAINCEQPYPGQAPPCHTVPRYTIFPLCALGSFQPPRVESAQMRLVALLVKLLCVDKTLLVHNCYKFAATIIWGQIVQATGGKGRGWSCCHCHVCDCVARDNQVDWRTSLF